MSSPPRDPAPSGRPTTTVARISASWEGPLPPPGVLQQYNNAFPGCAERLVAMAENQSKHRQDLERTVVAGNDRRADRGQIIGAFLAVLSIAGGVFLLYNGKSVEGYSTLIGAAAVFGGAYIISTRRQDQELKQKSGG